VTRTTLADRALDEIRGAAEAQLLLKRIAIGVAGVDELQAALSGVCSQDSDAVTKGFCRELQKRMEQCA
jgi:hypothetical protein